MLANHRTKFGLLGLVLASVVTFTGCEEKGPMQKAGEGIDQAGKDLKNAADPRGPMEKAGDKVDQAVGK